MQILISNIQISNDSLDIPSDDPDENPVIINVSGTGLSAAVNKPPSAFDLVFPANGQTGLGTTVTFRWKKSIDPDGDSLTYDLYNCDDSTVENCAPVVAASLGNNGVYYAGMGGLGTVLLFGLILIGSPKSGKKGTYLIVMVMITGMFLSACDGDGYYTRPSSSFAGAQPVVPPADEVTHIISGLSPGTTYFWKVVADDGNGGRTESDTWSFTTL